MIKCARADNTETGIPEEDKGDVVVESAGYLSQHALPFQRSVIHGDGRGWCSRQPRG